MAGTGPQLKLLKAATQARNRNKTVRLVLGDSEDTRTKRPNTGVSISFTKQTPTQRPSKGLVYSDNK